MTEGPWEAGGDLASCHEKFSVQCTVVKEIFRRVWPGILCNVLPALQCAMTPLVYPQTSVNSLVFGRTKREYW